MLIWTNDYHHIFFKKYSFFTFEYIRGWYFYTHGIYSYFLIFKGLLILLIYAYKNKGLFSKQAVLITLAVLISFVPNLLNFFSLVNLNIDITSITFTFFSFILFISMFKFDFLNIIPIALRTIVDNFTDSFIAVNTDLIILEYNKTFIEKTLSFYNIDTTKKVKFFLQDKKISTDEGIALLKNNILKTISSKEKLVYESCLKNENSEKYFLIEIIPLFHKDYCIGALVFFKNITSPKKEIHSLEEKNSKLDNLNLQLKKQYEYIETINQNLKELSEIDELTGAYNRRFFNHYYEIETLRSKNQLDYKTTINNITNFGIAIIDIDNFKNINDYHGHLVGDSILQQLVKKIKEIVFSKDILCRYGGEEFVVIFTKTTPEGVIKASEKIRKTISDTTFSLKDKDFKITISIGVASFDELLTKKTTSLLKLADDRLLKAKSSGKNKVIYKNNYKV
jgi:diguanylate cyclase (GGDEF)-like protein